MKRDEPRFVRFILFVAFFFLFCFTSVDGWALAKVFFFFLVHLRYAWSRSLYSTAERGDDDTARLDLPTGQRGTTLPSAAVAPTRPRHRETAARPGLQARVPRSYGTPTRGRPAKPTADACVRLRRVVSSTSSTPTCARYPFLQLPILHARL